MTTEIQGKNKGEIVEQLAEKFQVGTTTIYARFKKLGVQPYKENGQYYLNDHDLAEMGKLNDWIAEGNTIESFQTKGALVQSESSEMEPIQETIQLEEIEEGHQVNQIVTVAQQTAASVLIAQNILTKQFIENPELLSPDLLAQVNQSREAIAPKSINPLHLANQLVSRYQQQLAA